MARSPTALARLLVAAAARRASGSAASTSGSSSSSNVASVCSSDVAGGLGSLFGRRRGGIINGGGAGAAAAIAVAAVPSCSSLSLSSRPAAPSFLSFHSAPRAEHGDNTKDTAGKETISVTYHDDKDGSTKTVRVPLGTNLLEAAHANGVDLEGACECSLACSTCHVVVEDAGVYEKLPEPTDDENDMLDLAFGLTETSRLGCQIVASKEIDGISVRIPGATRNFAVDGHVPKPH